MSRDEKKKGEKIVKLQISINLNLSYSTLIFQSSKGKF